MPNIFLSPIAKETSIKGSTPTLTVGRDYLEIEPFLDIKEKNILSKQSKLRMWGNKETRKSSWKKMKVGDYIVFYSNGIFSYSAKILLTKFDEKLAKFLWTVDKEDDKTWPCIFFVDNLRKIEIPIGVIQNIAGYDSTWDRVMTLMPLRDSGIKAIENKFGSVETFLNQKPEVYIAIENIIETSKEENIEDEKFEVINKSKLIDEAKEFRNIGDSYSVDSSPRKVRIESKQQKKRIAALEDYSCQVCGWSLVWINSKGKKAFRIDIDHIIDKANGGGEELTNLWALCPNCHVKKTLGVIKVNLQNKKVSENEIEVKLHHDNHLGW